MSECIHASLVVGRGVEVTDWIERHRAPGRIFIRASGLDDALRLLSRCRVDHIVVGEVDRGGPAVLRHVLSTNARYAHARRTPLEWVEPYATGSCAA